MCCVGSSGPFVKTLKKHGWQHKKLASTLLYRLLNVLWLNKHNHVTTHFSLPIINYFVKLNF